MNLYYNYEINDFKRIMMQNEHFINNIYRYFNIFRDQTLLKNKSGVHVAIDH